MKVFRKGLTLVEILLVILLFSALAIFSFISIPAQVAKARDAIRKGHIDRIDKAIEEYYADTGCYPISLALCGNSLVLEDKTYISTLPCDPETKNSYVYVSEISSCPSWFQLYGILEYTEDKIIDKLGCRQGCGPECQFNYGSSSSNQKLNPFCDENGGSTPIPSSSPPPEILQYACSPGGGCDAYANPELSGCPDIYLNDPTCQDQCSFPKNRCHDARGKTN